MDHKNNTAATELSDLNFIPKMKADTLIEGYGDVLKTIYSPKFVLCPS
ncbi:MAG: DUF4070 domain-containing protein [Actinomycetota bacterium]|nr:DUF4070 domain-containing protein [Actinomycetota bacterium]